MKEQQEKCYREKYWEELDTDAKIERMKREVKRLRATIDDLSPTLAQLLTHDHSQGSIMYRLPQISHGMPGSIRNDNKYF